MARKGRVGAHVDLPWVGRRGTLPTACGEPCLRRGSSVLEPTLNVLKLGVRTRPKCQSDEMAPAVAPLVSGGIADRHNPTGVYSADELTVLPGGAPGGSGDSHRVIGAITAHVTARIGHGPLLAESGPKLTSASDPERSFVLRTVPAKNGLSTPRLSSRARRRSQHLQGLRPSAC
jgi:hypothetical protein